MDPPSCRIFHDSGQHIAAGSAICILPFPQTSFDPLDNTQCGVVSSTHFWILKPLDPQATAESSVVHVQNFDFRFDPGMPWVLKNVNLTCPRGSRTLLIGASNRAMPIISSSLNKHPT